MPKTLINFAARHGLPLTQEQAEKLVAYARCVWEKKDVLNLTSASSLQEVLARHICDGLVAAAEIHRAVPQACKLADVGAGCGYIGLTLAIALPHTHVTLVESIERRCKFMNWAVLAAGIGNVTVLNARLGQGTRFAFDVVTERAMGQLPDIFGVCMQALKPGGIFMAFQGAHPQTAPQAPLRQLLYTLPCDKQPRYLVVFKKVYVENRV